MTDVRWVCKFESNAMQTICKIELIVAIKGETRIRNKTYENKIKNRYQSLNNFG